MFSFSRDLFRHAHPATNTRNGTALMVRDVDLLLDRHQHQRHAQRPTLSVFVGPLTSAQRAWRTWAGTTNRGVVLGHDTFPYASWLEVLAANVPLHEAALHAFARRAGREPSELIASWLPRTPADRAAFFATLAPHDDDTLLQELTTPDQTTILPHNDATIRAILRITPAARWPAVLFIACTPADLATVGRLAATWALREPGLPLALSISHADWETYRSTASDSRTQALLREGVIELPSADFATVERTLTASGIVGPTVAVLAECGGDPHLLEAAIATQQVVSVPPADTSDDSARSAAERFLFDYLEGLPETAGRFVLNHELAFRFGPRPAEVDLCCPAARVAVELDGYFHFLQADSYRRDRRKDWELQKRGYRILRFLAADVVQELETIRDRILDALTPREELP